MTSQQQLVCWLLDPTSMYSRIKINQYIRSVPSTFRTQFLKIMRRIFQMGWWCKRRNLKFPQSYAPSYPWFGGHYLRRGVFKKNTVFMSTVWSFFLMNGEPQLRARSFFVCFVHTHRIHACMMNLYLYMYHKHQQSTEWNVSIYHTEMLQKKQMPYFLLNLLFDLEMLISCCLNPSIWTSSCSWSEDFLWQWVGWSILVMWVPFGKLNDGFFALDGRSW